MSAENKKYLPWLDPKDKEAGRDGNPAYVLTSDKAADQVYKPGYALGFGPRGKGYYSFETKVAYKIMIQNLKPKKRGQALKALFSNAAKKKLKTTLSLASTREGHMQTSQRMISLSTVVTLRS